MAETKKNPSVNLHDLLMQTQLDNESWHAFEIVSEIRERYPVVR